MLVPGITQCVYGNAFARHRGGGGGAGVQRSTLSSGITLILENKEGLEKPKIVTCVLVRTKMMTPWVN